MKKAILSFLILSTGPFNLFGTPDSLATLLFLLQFGSLEKVSASLATGVNVKEKFGPGCTALHVAALIDCPEKVSALIRCDPDLLNARDQNGQTPLHYAAHNGSIFAASTLIENGAHIEDDDNTGKKPYDLATSTCHPHMAEHLKKAVWNKRWLERYNTKTFLESMDHRGKTPEAIAIDDGHSKMAENISLNLPESKSPSLATWMINNC